jgi:hypothetical protein
MNWNTVNNSASVAILEANRLGELLASLGFRLDILPDKTVYRASCPVHGGDGDGFVLTLGGDTLPIRWKCWSAHCEERLKPSLLGLVRGLLEVQAGPEVSLKAAADHLRNFLGGLPSASQATPRPQPEPKLLTLTRQQVRGRLEIPSPYFVVRGFSPAVLDMLDVGHSGKMRRTVVPIYDDTAERCIGYTARSEKPVCERCRKCHRPGDDCRFGQSKWALPEGFPKGAYLYHYAAALRSDVQHVFLVEGAGDVFSLIAAGYLAVAALGSELSDLQVEKLAALQKEVIISFDNDPAGKKGSAAASKALRARGVPERTWFPPSGFHDLGDMPVSEVIRWVNEYQRSDDELDEALKDPKRPGPMPSPVTALGHQPWPSGSVPAE